MEGYLTHRKLMFVQNVFYAAAVLAAAFLRHIKGPDHLPTKQQRV